VSCVGASQAGAKHVYAVEASGMAEYARKLVAGNHPLSQRITVRLPTLDFQKVDAASLYFFDTCLCTVVGNLKPCTGLDSRYPMSVPTGNF